MRLETKRLALTAAMAQVAPIFLLIIFSGLLGAIVAVVALISMATAVIAYMLMLWQVGTAKCPSCGRRYFPVMPISFVIARRCVSCGVKEGEPAGSYWRPQ